MVRIKRINKHKTNKTMITTSKKDILKLYLKDIFTSEENEIINNSIEKKLIETDEIKEDCLTYIYNRIEKEYKNKFNLETIWEYTDEHLSNGLTHKENYNNLIDYLQNN